MSLFEVKVYSPALETWIRVKRKRSLSDAQDLCDALNDMIHEGEWGAGKRHAVWGVNIDGEYGILYEEE